ncbi:MAG: C40 family peptidase [Alphaproteobacteria bacterium]|nr:C40 family peptidase [Alphaproteobacteria bacterium]
MADSFDKRVTPARLDLAASFLKDKVQAERYADGQAFISTRGHTPLRACPESYAAQETELLFGELFTVYEQKDGWAWGQIASDGYVGYLHALTLEAPVIATHRVSVPATPVLVRCDAKAASLQLLPMNAQVRVERVIGDFCETNAGFVFTKHLVPLGSHESDFTAVAERFVGAPYVWGGKTFAGLDCSGLVQTSLAACGVSAPRDTDMMERALGTPVAIADARRGDLVFWKGHMGIVLDGARFLHANAFHMQVTLEPLAEALARNEKFCGPLTSVKRL